LIFDLISGVRGVTILFDEIDDLLRERNTNTGPTEKPTFMELVIPAMLNRLADLRDACPRQEICFLLATNFVESIEPALLRKGRIDSARPVVYPDQESRVALIMNLTGKQIVTSEFRDALKKKLRIKEDRATKLISAYYYHFASELEGWPYLTIESACTRIAKNWNATLKEMVSDRVPATFNTKNGRRSLKNIRKQFLDKSTESIKQVIVEFGSGVSEPKYDQRLRPPFRSELVDEYAHFIVSRHASAKALEEWVITHFPPIEGANKLLDDDEDAKRATKLCEGIYNVLQKENRWPKNHRLRNMLRERASNHKRR
jgi:ATPase family associated with various cellular activities (AAA)